MSDAEGFDSKMDGDPDGTITVSGGQGPNFDDFESMENSREQYVESRETKETKKEETVSEEVEESEAKIEADENIEHSAEKDPEKIEVKFLKAKIGESELELDPDTEIPVSIDGVTEYRKIGDLRNHEAGQVSWDRKFSKLDTDMKSREEQVASRESEFSEFSKDRDALFQDIGKMHELIQANKPYDAMEFLVAQSGGNKYAFKRALIEQLGPEFDRLSMMTPEELNAENSHNEAAFLKEQMRTLKDQQEAEANQMASQRQIAQLRESRGISQEIYDASTKELVESGRQNPEPQLVVEYAHMKPMVERSEKLVESIHPPSLDNDELVIEMAKIFSEDSSITDEEASSLLRDALGLEGKEQRVLEKAKGTGQVRREPENPGNYKYYGSSEPGSDDHVEGFADYDDLY